MWVDYTSPWQIDKAGVPFTGTIKKVNPCSNITINNVKLYDEFVVTTAKDPNNTAPNRNFYVSGLAFKYAFDFKVNNIEGTNTKFPLIFTLYSSHATIRNLKLLNPAIVGDGEGYGVQFNYTKNIELTDAYSEGARHLVDFTGAAFAKVTNVQGIRSYSNTFQQHGFYEHNIFYRNTLGSFNGGSGINFGNASRHVEFDNHNGWISGSYLNDYTIKNSKIKLSKPPSDSRIENSEVLIYTTAAGFSPEGRTPTSQRELVFIDCTVDIQNDSATGVFKDFKSLTFERCIVGNTYNGTNGFAIELDNVSRLALSNCSEIKGIRFKFKGTNNQKVDIRNSDIIGSINTEEYFITGDGTGSCTVNVTVSDSNFIGQRPDGNKFKAVKSPTNATSAVTETIINLTNNVFENSEVTGVKTSDVDVFKTRGNILKTASTFSVDTTIAHKIEDNVSI